MLKASDYIDAVIETVKSWGIPTVLFNPEFIDEDELKNLVTPAVLVLCDSMGGSEFSPSGSGSLLEPVEIDFVCLIAKSRKEDSARAAFNLASFVKRRTTGCRWGLGEMCFNPTKITAMNATGSIKGFTEWHVSFHQGFELEPVADDDIEINGIYLGINPQSDDDFELIGEQDE